jgi:hypothetical protein
VAEVEEILEAEAAAGAEEAALSAGAARRNERLDRAEQLGW